MRPRCRSTSTDSTFISPVFTASCMAWMREVREVEDGISDGMRENVRTKKRMNNVCDLQVLYPDQPTTTSREEATRSTHVNSVWSDVAMRALRRKAWAGVTKAVRLHEQGALGSTTYAIPQLNNVACNVNSTTRCHSMWTYFAGSQCKLVAMPSRRCHRTNTTSAACIPATLARPHCWFV